MKIIRVLFLIIYQILFLIGVLFIILYLLGIHPYVILSGSMEPTLPTGGIVLVNTKACTPREGDIITYQKGRLPVTHRVIKYENGKYTTKGDANDVPDSSLVMQRQIIGTAVCVIPCVGYLLKNRWINVLILSAIGLWGLWDRRMSIKK